MGAVGNHTLLKLPLHFLIVMALSKRFQRTKTWQQSARLEPDPNALCPNAFTLRAIL